MSTRTSTAAWSPINPVPREVLDAGIDVIRWLAAHRTPLATDLFLAATGVGSTLGYLVMLPIVWWAFSWKLGARLFVALVLSVYLNALLKDGFAVDRPFLYAPVNHITTPDEYSFPSGHAQNAALVWGLLALHFRKRWFSCLAAVLVLLIGASRVYLGVHFPTDVLAGWCIGALLAWAYASWSRALAGRASELRLSVQIALALGVPSLLTLLHGTRNTAMALGGLAGALGGLAVARSERLYPKDPPGRRRAWLLVGLVGLPILYLGLEELSPETYSSFYYLYLFLRFAAVGLWVSFVVPRIAARVKEGEP
jgi:membrane-associated phospholipid phosphatase